MSRITKKVFRETILLAGSVQRYRPTFTALRWQGIEKQKISMSTQVDLFTNVEPTSVSPAIAKLPVSRSTLYLGDCLVEMSKIADKSIDMILVDLPYGTIAQKWDIKIDFVKLWEHYERIIVDNGAILFFGSQPFTTDIINSNRKLFKYCWVWEKDRGGNIMTCKFQPYKNYEDIIVFCFKIFRNKRSWSRRVL